MRLKENYFRVYLLFFDILEKTVPHFNQMLCKFQI